MADFIEREALKVDLQESYNRLRTIYDGLTHDEDKQLCAGQLTTFTEAILRVKEAPAADVVEVRHGQMIEGECTVCGWHGDCVDTPYYNYCPNCGCKMDKGG